MNSLYLEGSFLFSWDYKFKLRKNVVHNIFRLSSPCTFSIYFSAHKFSGILDGCNRNLEYHLSSIPRHINKIEFFTFSRHVILMIFAFIHFTSKICTKHAWQANSESFSLLLRLEMKSYPLGHNK